MLGLGEEEEEEMEEEEEEEGEEEISPEQHSCWITGKDPFKI